MADQIQQEPEKGKEDEGGTLQDALNRAKRESIFTGHPAEDTPLEGPEDEPGKGNDKDKDKGGDKGKGEQDKDKQTPEPEPGKTEEPEKFEFKYKSHEEAERGAKEAERLMHEKSEEAKKARDRADDLQRQINELTLQMNKLREEPGKDKETKPSSRTPEIVAGLLKEIEKLDTEAEDYQGKVAEIWGKALDQGISERLEQALTDYEKRKERERKEQETKDSKSAGVVKLAGEKATESGLNMKHGSDDSKLFWAMADLAPEGDIDSQIIWTIKEVQRIKGAIGSKFTEAADKAKQTQEDNEVLGRQGPGPEKTKPEDQAPLSLSKAMQMNERRI
jgi:hypothetical protein